VGLKRQIVRYAWRAAAQRTAEVAGNDPEILRREFRVDPDWRRVESGYAPRLDARTTIAMDRVHGPWKDVDTLAVNDAWRRPWAAAGLAVWGAAVGLQWWRGASRGKGPLRVLHDRGGHW
jgi:hypothetical protein